MQMQRSSAQLLLGAVGLASAFSPHSMSTVRSTVTQATSVKMGVLAGETLDAALKMRCDNSGAGYAIYWETDSGEVVCKGTYTTEARKEELKALGKDKSYADRSEEYRLTVEGDGPIATVLRTGKPVFIEDPGSNENLRRKELAEEYGIQALAVVPFEDGVVEFGTSKGEATATWNSMPEVPVMPKLVMAQAFKQLSASYCMYWKLNAEGRFEVSSSYVRQSRLEALAKLRDDGATFCSQSALLTLPHTGTNPVSKCVKTEQEIFVEDMQNQGFSKVLRGDLAKEFGIKSCRFFPVEGGCFEYGIPN